MSGPDRRRLDDIRRVHNPAVTYAFRVVQLSGSWRAELDDLRGYLTVSVVASPLVVYVADPDGAPAACWRAIM